MAAIPVTLVGSISVAGQDPVTCTILADMTYTGLGVGGGPIVPPGQPPSGGVPIHPIWGPPGFNPPGPGMPPGIWGGPVIPPPGGGGGAPGVPIHPIWGPPGFNPPGPGMPPGIWGGPVGGGPDVPPAPEAPPDAPGAMSPQTDMPGSGTQWYLCWIPGVGWRYIALDAGETGK